MRIETRMIGFLDAKTKKGDAYQICEIDYKNDRGENKSKKLYPFGDGKGPYDVVAKLTKGDIIDVQTVKNAEGFLDWVEVKLASDEPPAAKTVASKPVEDAKASWADDNAQRQSSIERQSSLKTAIDFYGLPGNDGATHQDVIDTAEYFAAFVASRIKGADPLVPADEFEDIPG